MTSPEPTSILRVRPREDKIKRQVAYLFWHINGGPSVRLSQVASHMGVTEDVIRYWWSHDAWDERWRLSVRDAEKAASPNDFRVSDHISRQEIDRAMVDIWTEMMDVIRAGGMRTIADGRPLVSFSIRDVRELAERLEAALDREALERSNRLLSGTPKASRSDLELLMKLPVERLRGLRSFVQATLAAAASETSGPPNAVVSCSTTVESEVFSDKLFTEAVPQGPVP